MLGLKQIRRGWRVRGVCLIHIWYHGTPMDEEYTWIFLRGKCCQFRLLTSTCVLWLVGSSSGKGGNGLKVVDEDNRYLVSCEYHFIREHENLV